MCVSFFVHGFPLWDPLLPCCLDSACHVLCANPSQQPTDFWLDTYTIKEVFDTPDLVTSLAQFSEQLQHLDHTRLEYSTQVQSAAAAATPQSILFLRIQAAASYYTTNRTLMEHPEPVDVDISV
jgi:hypothetical protein